mmetsp:Transcript_2875/g.8070  ORF Transcript_2875/g.8070 Transcript_2875/m.8070 type:complete len:118 (-) Transcript_2875:125-478(-)
MANPTPPITTAKETCSKETRVSWIVSHIVCTTAAAVIGNFNIFMRTVPRSLAGLPSADTYMTQVCLPQSRSTGTAARKDKPDSQPPGQVAKVAHLPVSVTCLVAISRGSQSTTLRLF